MSQDRSEEIMRHFDVVAERLEGQIRQVAEGVVLNGERLDRVDSRLDRVETQLEKVEVRLDSVDHRLDKVEARLDGVDQRLDGIDRRLDGMDQRFDGMDQRFDGMDQRFDGMDQRFDGMDQRFDAFQTYVHAEFAEVKSMIKFSYAELDGRINTLEREVGDLRSRVERIESKLAS